MRLFHLTLLKKKIASTLAIILLLPGLLLAQRSGTKDITGKVTDNTGAPLSGVSVKVKEATTVAVTGNNGAFTIKAKEGDVLVFSSVSFTKKEIIVKAGTSYDVVLEASVAALSDVVVVGYGKGSRKALSSSITSIKPEDLNRGAISDVGQLMQGKVAGLNISASGDPNKAAAVILRGASTVNSPAGPFYVIDGIPGADIATVAPDDIASIDVLKDAAATAIYGNRAANGVIMITTKKGKKGVSKISYSAYQGFEQVSNQLKMMNATQLRTFCASTNQAISSSDDLGADTNWQKAIERSTALSTNHNLSFSGGSEHSNYSANISYNNTQGIIQQSNSRKIIAHLSFEQLALNDKLKLGVSLANAKIVSDNVPQQGTVLLQAASYLPVSPIKKANGSYFENFTNTGYFNPVALMNHGQDQTKYNNLAASFTAHAILPWGLTYDMSLSYQNYNSLHGEYYDSYCSQYNSANFYNNPDPPATRSLVNFGTNGSALRSTYQTTNQIFENYFTWNHKFGEHSINAVVGYSWQENELGDGFQATTTNFPVDNIGYMNLSLSNYSGVSGYTVNFGSDQTYYKTRLISDFGRLNYSYNDKYYVQASIRRDGGSVFGANHHWGYFPSVGLSWRVGQENFIQKLNIFYDLKLRASYGVTGNASGFSAYTAQFISGNLGSFYYNGTTTSAYGPTQAANADLQWEKTSTANLGLDASVLNGRLSFNIDVYNKNTTGMIYSYNTDIMLNPIGSIVANGGSMNNKGIELSISATLIQKRDFSWKTSLNLAHNKNTITSLSNKYFTGGDSIRYTQPDGSGQTGSTLQIYKVGKPLGEFFTLQYAGKNAQGISQYVAADGSLTTTPAIGKDYHYAGSPQPKLTYGWSNTFVYRNFDLNVFLRGVYGNKIFDATRADLFRPTTAHLTNILVDAGNESIADVNSYKYSTRFIEDGSYLRLESMTLGYSLKSPVKYIDNIRFYGTVNNLFVITGYKGVDPEVNQGGSAPGIDSNNFYPKTRTVLFGVNVMF